jgi:hypothetical protein
MFAVYLFVSSLSSLSVDPDTDAAPENDDTTDDLAFAAEQPGKHPPFEHAYIAYSLLSCACIRIAAVTALPILMHDLIL